MQAYSSSNQEVKPTCPSLNLQWLYGSIWPTKHGRTDAVLFWVWASRGLKVFAFAYFTYLLFCCVVCRILVPWLAEGNGNPLQYSCLENPTDRGAWWAAVYGDAQSRKRLKQLSSSSRLQQYLIQELPDVQAGFRKGRGTRDQIVNIYWIMEKARDSIKPSTSASLSTLKPLTVWITTNWKILKEMGIIPDHLTCLLKNLYADQEATVRTGNGTMGWFKIGKGVHQGGIL